MIINFDCHLGGINIAIEDANEAHLWVCLCLHLQKVLTEGMKPMLDVSSTIPRAGMAD